MIYSMNYIYESYNMISCMIHSVNTDLEVQIADLFDSI